MGKKARERNCGRTSAYTYIYKYMCICKGSALPSALGIGQRRVTQTQRACQRNGLANPNTLRRQHKASGNDGPLENRRRVNEMRELIYINICVAALKRVHIYARKCLYVAYVGIHTSDAVRKHIHTRTYIHTYIYIYTYVEIPVIYIHSYAYVRMFV